MRWLRRFLLLLGSLFGLFAGLLSLFIGSQLHKAADVGRPTPQSIRLDRLIADGPGDNAHVEITDFRFGSPIVEKEGDRWSRVWVPIEPSDSAKPPARPAILLMDLSPDQARLDQLLSQKTVSALATSAFDEHTIWEIKPTDALRQAQPGLDPNKALFLQVNPVNELEWGIILFNEDQIFERVNAQMMRGLGWSVLAAAGVCLVLLVRSLLRRPLDLRKLPNSPDDVFMRERLASEPPISIHRLRFAGAMGRSVLLVLAAFMCFVFSLQTAGMGAIFVQRSEPVSAAISFIFALGLFIGVFLLLGAAVKAIADCPQIVAVCPGGLRWRHFGRERCALWTDIAKCHRLADLRYRIRIEATIIQVKSGERLHIWDHAITDYLKFVDLVLPNFDEEGNPRTGFNPWAAAMRKAASNECRARDWTG